jgi:hypothetical protein
VNVSSLDFAGSFSVELTTLARVNESLTVGGQQLALALPAGPYLRVAGEGITLTIEGQKLTGNFSFEQLTDPGADGSSIARRPTPDDIKLSAWPSAT